MNADVLTLFPQWFEWFLTQRHVENALALGHTVEAVDLRETTPLKWGQVDDTPFGGGAGMVLRVDVMEAALRARYGVDPVELPRQRRVIALTPSGRVLDDALASELAQESARDAAVRPLRGLRRAHPRPLRHQSRCRSAATCWRAASWPRWSCSTRVLRKLPGVLGDDESAVEESFSEALDGAPEYPHYTRPADWRGWAVPDVLLSGHHARIHEWRHEQSRTARGRSATMIDRLRVIFPRALS